jgi:hypothetical protein
VVRGRMALPVGSGLGVVLDAPSVDRAQVSA